MSDQKNAIKSKAKQLVNLLNAKGLSLKHTQSIEVMSKLLYNKPWHSIPNNVDGCDLSSLPKGYIDSIGNYDFVEKLVFGFDEKLNKLHEVKQSITPNLLICGSSGSGKTNSLKFTLLTHIANNSHNTMYFLIDTESGMTEFSNLHRNFSSNVKTSVVDGDFNSFSRVEKMIDYLNLELNMRQKHFHKNNVSNYLEYEKKTGKSLTRFVVSIENAYTIFNHKEVKFSSRENLEDSTAGKIKNLFRLGRKFGIIFLCSSYRGTYSDIPSTINSAIGSKLLFKSNVAAEPAMMGLDHGREIKSTDTGLCAYEGGFLRVPYVSHDIEDYILKNFYKPLKSSSLIDEELYFD
jgi:hypothetical protein